MFFWHVYTFRPKHWTQSGNQRTRDKVREYAKRIPYSLNSQNSRSKKLRGYKLDYNVLACRMLRKDREIADST